MVFGQLESRRERTPSAELSNLGRSLQRRPPGLPRRLESSGRGCRIYSASSEEDRARADVERERADELRRELASGIMLLVKRIDPLLLSGSHGEREGRCPYGKKQQLYEHEKRCAEVGGGRSRAGARRRGYGLPPLRAGGNPVLWVGVLKFVEYEAEQIQPMVSTSPLFSRINRMLGKRKLAGLIGITEIVLGALIAARPLSPKASALGGLGATAMFLTTLSFILSMPGVWHEQHGFPALSFEGQFLAKDGVLLDAVDQFPVYSGAYLATLEQLDL